jgi:hypothetical protein
LATSDLLTVRADEIDRLLEALLIEHSSVTENPPMPDFVIWVGPTHAWNGLEESGRSIQAKLRAQHAQFSALVAAMLRTASQRVQGDVAQAAEKVKEIIDQERARTRHRWKRCSTRRGRTFVSSS